MAFTFRGGIKPDLRKEISGKRKIETLNPPKILVFPMDQHMGALCNPIVRKGDYVKIGQVIADGDTAMSVPIHSSVSGIVKDIIPMESPKGGNVMSVVIENDEKEEWVENKISMIDPNEINAHELANIAKNAGIVGMGGEAFPTHVKIRLAVNKAKVLIINGAECEPYLTADYRLMIEKADEIFLGIKLFAKVIDVEHAYIAIEDHNIAAVKIMNELCEKEKHISVKILRTKYPQGSEKLLVKVITGKEIPPGKKAIDAGCVVFNVGTCHALWNAYRSGKPLIERVVTVSGYCTAALMNLNVRIGTPIKHLFEFCAGFEEEPDVIIYGGPMMGESQTGLEVPVVKSMSGVLAMSNVEAVRKKEKSCINCGRCVRACPMKLMPNYLALYSKKEMFERCKKYNIEDCIECGCCSYVCPSRISVLQYICTAKEKSNIN